METARKYKKEESVKMGILNVIQKTLDEQGNGAKLLGSGKRIIESSAQAEYNDVRKVERNYTHGVHNAKEKEKRAKVIWRTHVGTKVYLSNGAFTDCHDQRKADRLTDNEAKEWLEKSTPHCTYWIEDIQI